MSGLSSGLESGVRVAQGIGNAYLTGVAIREQDKAIKIADEERALQKDINGAFTDAVKGGYDAQGNLTVSSPVPPPDAAPGAAPADPNAAPMSAVKAVVKDSRSNEQRYLDGFAAAERLALERKRPDLAMEAHKKSEMLADQYRDKEYAAAWGRYNVTRDPNDLVGYVKRFVRDGTDFGNINVTRGPDGQDRIAFTITNPDGKQQRVEDLTRAQFEEAAQMYTDPVRARMASIKRAEQLAEARIKIEVARSSRAPVVAEAGKSVYDPATNSSSIVEGTTIEKVKGPEGEGEQLWSITYGKQGEIGRVNLTQHQNNMVGFNSQETKRYSTASDEIGKIINKEMAQGVPNPQAGVIQQRALVEASNMVAANRGSPVQLEPANLADYSLKIARGEIKVGPIPVKVGGQVVGQADGFVIGNNPIYTNPMQLREIEGRVRGQQQVAATAAAQPRTWGGENRGANPAAPTPPGAAPAPQAAPPMSAAAPGAAPTAEPGPSTPMAATPQAMQVPPQVQQNRDLEAARQMAMQNTPQQLQARIAELQTAVKGATSPDQAAPLKLELQAATTALQMHQGGAVPKSVGNTGEVAPTAETPEKVRGEIQAIDDSLATDTKMSGGKLPPDAVADAKARRAELVAKLEGMGKVGAVQPATQQPRMAQASQPLPSSEQAAGTALDKAREDVRAARAALDKFGLNQKRKDPEGFKAAKARLEAAKAARDQALTAWQGIVGPQAATMAGARYRRAPSEADARERAREARGGVPDNLSGM